MATEVAFLSWPPAELVALEVLEAAAPNGCFGMDIVERSKGKIGRVYVYILLDRLEQKGFVCIKKVPGRRPGASRRMYMITMAGRQALSFIALFDFTRA
jgi:DNA-binding PadR family transcriptional regulator